MGFSGLEVNAQAIIQLKEGGLPYEVNLSRPFDLLI
jgi:hypothetical protein